MNFPPILQRLALILLSVLIASTLHAQGPPYQTDDPVPVGLNHYEFYIFGGMDGTPAEIDSTGPAFEFNWGALPRVQLHALLPLGGVFPSNKPMFPGSTGSSAFGLTDMELGVKVAWFKETKHIPQIGTFTMFEIPTGNSDKGLGVGKVWYKIPVWMQKNIGHWLLDGGVGYQIVSQDGYRNFPYAGFLVKYTFGKTLELGGEVFAHGRDGFAPGQSQSSAMVDLGGYYHFKHLPGMQFLFCYGHSVAGQSENYAYMGLYWTWGRGDKNAPGSNARSQRVLDAVGEKRAGAIPSQQTFMNDAGYNGRGFIEPGDWLAADWARRRRYGTVDQRF
jgi:hypothetical protein